MDEVPRCCLRCATRGPERLQRSGVARGDVDDTILAPYVYREAAALKDPWHRKVVERTSAAPSLFAPEPRKMPVGQQRKDNGGSFQGPQFGVGDPFPVPPFAYPSALEGW